MARYIVIYRVDGTRHSDRVKATSPEDAEQKLRSWYPGCQKFDVVSIKISTLKPVSGSYYKPFVSLPTFKQFTCSFTVKNNGFLDTLSVPACYRSSLHRERPPSP